MDPIRLLLLGDTHVGFDTPRRPRTRRPRRGADFLRCFEHALEPAFRGEVDLVVHGGDLFHRSEPTAAVAEQGLAPLRRVAERGVPVFLVPGNHERSRIPCPLFAAHPNLYVFHEPRTFTLQHAGCRIAISGFPFARKVRGGAFQELLWASRFGDEAADLRLLVIHQAVEGARCGPGDFTFRSGGDVVAAADLPQGADAVLSGHIHRQQVLRRDLRGRPLRAPVYYAGSVERTSFAEQAEPKGALLLELAPGAPIRHRCLPLPARPMITLELEGGPGAEERLARWLGACPRDAVVRVDLRGPVPPPRAAALRAITPRGIHLSVRWRGVEAVGARIE